ncbi:MAG: GtrA family protein [Bacteroidetes bacterium]|nr:MAG: GtrA family protein [Bacteroidota bacterium]
MIKLRFGKFFITNLIGTTIDTIVIFIFKEWVFHSYFFVYIITPIIGFEIAAVNNYTISFFWVWKDRTVKKSKTFLKNFLPYNLTVISVFGVRLILIIIISKIVKLDVVFCNLIALLFSGLLNYLGLNKLVFRKKIKSKINGY